MVRTCTALGLCLPLLLVVPAVSAAPAVKTRYSVLVRSVVKRASGKVQRLTRGPITLTLRKGRAELKYDLTTMRPGRGFPSYYRDRVRGTYRRRGTRIDVTLCPKPRSPRSSTYRAGCWLRMRCAKSTVRAKMRRGHYGRIGVLRCTGAPMALRDARMKGQLLLSARAGFSQNRVARSDARGRLKERAQYKVP